MKRPPDAVPPRSRRSLLPTLGVVALAAVPLLAFGRGEQIGYDAFWHVFIARQDDWPHLWGEIRRNAHPPLFYLFLKAAIALLGTSPLAYRLVSIAATLGATWLVGRIVRRIARRPWLPEVAALAFGLSLTTVTVGLDVRAYALGTVFMLWAFLALLDLVDQAFAAAHHRARAVFAVMTCLALLTHYVAAFFLLACLLAPVVLAAVDREYGRRLFAQGRRHWRANLLTLGVPLTVFAIEYAVHVAWWSGRITHLPEFLFDPRREGVLGFWWRNTGALLELFVPALSHRPYASTLMVDERRLADAAVAVLVACALAAVGWQGFRAARRGGSGAIARRVPAVLLATMTAMVIALALVGRYPYGGQLRHQYLLFPFAVIVLTLLVDEVALRTRRWIGGLAVGLFALASLLNAANWLTQFRINRGLRHQAQMDRLRELFPAPEAIYVDQFNLVHLFAHHHRRRWRFVRGMSGRAAVDVWRVGDAGARGFYVCRDSAQWQLDLSRRGSYRRIRRCLDATGAGRVAVFRPQQEGRPASWPLARTGELAARWADRAGLIPESVAVDGEDVYAEFSRR